MKNKETNQNIQISGHDTFPLRQLWLKKAVNYSQEAHKIGKTPNFNNEEAIAKLGVGANMARAMKFWAVQAQFLDPTNDLRPTELAELIFGNDETEGVDPYNENPSTSWIVHWNLSSKKNRMGIFWFLFNYSNRAYITREHLLKDFKEFVQYETQKKLSLNTLKRDVNVCFGSYAFSKEKKINEELIEPFLGGLHLLEQTNNSSVRLNRTARPSLSNAIFAWSLVSFWNENELFKNQSTLDFMRIYHDIGSPGKVFRLTENSLVERLEELEELTEGKLVWSDQSGVRSLIRKIFNKSDIAELQHKLLLKAFKNERE